MDEPTDLPERPRRRGIYLLPNLLTTGSLFAGFYGIIASIDGRYEPAAIAVIIAGVLDGLDGRLARLMHTESEFGKQYDSLSDMVSFGVAPAVIVYQWGLVRLADYGWIWAKLGWLAAFVYAVAAALRLARFNVHARTADRRFFEGLPSPSAAGLMMSMVWLGTDLGWTGVLTLALALLVSASAGALMVSRFSYYSFKEMHPRGRISFRYALVVPLTLVLIAMDPPKVLFAIGVTYALSGPALALWRRHRRRAGRLSRHAGEAENLNMAAGAPTAIFAAGQREILQEMGIELWIRRSPAAGESADAGKASAGALAWGPLRDAVRTCTRCTLHRTRTQTVFGVGNESARWMIVGEAPGGEEDRQGEPFVGPAGQLLNEMLRAVGLERNDVFIANILKCRPPDNRDPKLEEIAACADHLAAQMRLLSPKLILAVGRIAAQSLLQQFVPVGRLRGRAHAYGPAGVPLVVTYHPAYLLRSPGEKRKAWDDLRLARSLVDPLPP